MDTMDVALISISVLILAVRLSMLSRMWRLPLRHGEEYFFAQRVPAGFYNEVGATLLRQYRRSLFIPLVLDAPLAIWLIVTERLVQAFVEQWLAILVTIVIYNMLTAHFSVRATTMAGHQDELPTAVQLSMSPRRLRDYTNWPVEAVIWALMLTGVVLTRAYAFGGGRGEDADPDQVWAALGIPIWISYLEAGLLLLKVVFVRWRMPLPANRTEDFRKWRGAWLNYHLKLMDSIRMLFAALMVTGLVAKIRGEGWSRTTLMITVPGWIVMLTVYLIYITRESRRLATVQREVKPEGLVKEFPRRPVPAGRFFAGGLLYFNRDNPVLIVRSARGIAINLAHYSAYVWVAYFIGLMTLSVLVVR